MSFKLPQNPNFAVELNPDNTLCICEYLGSAQVMTIPEKIGKYTVTKIAANFCENMEDMISVVMPDTIKEVGKYAFCGCYDLRSIKISKGLSELPESFCKLTNIAEVNIPDSIHTIGKDSFQDCIRLKVVDLGNGVKNIGRWAFTNCHIKEIHLGPNVENINYERGCFLLTSHLEKFTVDKNNQHFRDIDGVLFSKDGKTLIRFPEKMMDSSKKSVLTSYTVPRCTRNIAEEAFTGCSLYDIKMHKNIKEIKPCFTAKFIRDEGTHIICQKGSVAEKFAKKYNINVKIEGSTITDFLEEIYPLEK